eukprot:gene26079-biopygen13672
MSRGGYSRLASSWNRIAGSAALIPALFRSRT